MLPVVHGEFRVVEDPELRFTPSGAAVCNIRLVANSRKKVNDEWQDDKVCWLNGTAWRQMAENIAESITKGDLVVITGKIETRSYETREGEKRSVTDLIIDEIGAGLRYATAKVTKADRRSGGGGGGGGGSSSGGSSSGGGEDPWAGPPPNTDEPPF